MRPRLAVRALRARLTQAPAAALLGPRQSGKTTLGRSLAERYYDAEQPADRVRLDLEWEAVAGARGPTVIDEAQAWPEVFPRLRAAIDADRRRNGRFLLLGSVSPALMREVSQSLAGRLALIELTPFLLPEVGVEAQERLWLTGGFPDGGVLGRARRFPDWQRDYLALMAQRDLPAWGLAARPQVTDRFLGMLAVAHAQPWNASALGQSLGLSYHTVNGYLDHLEGAFLVRRLAPWTGNLGKRLVRSPRVYLRDTGLLHALLGVGSHEELLRHPGAGASWEGFVLEQLLGSLQAGGVRADPHYLRTSDGHEADLVLRLGGAAAAIEIKLSASPSPQDLARLERVADMIGAEHRYIVCNIARPAASGTRGMLNLATAIARLGRLAGVRLRGRAS